MKIHKLWLSLKKDSYEFICIFADVTRAMCGCNPPPAGDLKNYFWFRNV